MDRYEHLRGRTSAAIEQGGGDTERLATEWAMPFIPDDGGNSPTDVPFRGGGQVTRRPVSGLVVFAGRIMMVFGLVVLLSGVFAGFNLLHREMTRNLDPQTFAVTGVPTVRIENAVGDVRVVAGSGDRVEVRARVTARHLSRGLAEQALDGYKLDAATDARGIVVIRAGEGSPFEDGPFRQRSVDLTVTMPANGNLDLDVSAGRTAVEGITGRVKAEVNAGSLNLLNTKLADGSSFKVNAGGIYFNGELLPDASIDLEVNAGGAELVLPKSTAARLEATAEAGSVRANGWSGTVSSSRIRTDDQTVINGYLTPDTTTKSLITVTVNAGSAEINGRSDGAPDPAPPAPAAPSAPPAPPAR